MNISTLSLRPTTRAMFHSPPQLDSLDKHQQIAREIEKNKPAASSNATPIQNSGKRHRISSPEQQNEQQNGQQLRPAAEMSLEDRTIEMLETMRQLTFKNLELEKAVSFNSEEIENLKKRNDELSNHNKTLELRLTNVELKVQKLSEDATKDRRAHDSLDNNCRKYNLEISGIPGDENEDRDECKKIAAKVFTLIGSPLTKANIDVAHRLKSGGVIIVRFKSRTDQDAVYKLRSKLKAYTTKDLGYQLPIEGNKIFLNESLTFERRKLLGEIHARMKPINRGRDKDSFFKVVTSGGKIRVMDKYRKFHEVWKIDDLFYIHPEAAASVVD